MSTCRHRRRVDRDSVVAGRMGHHRAVPMAKVAGASDRMGHRREDRMVKVAVSGVMVRRAASSVGLAIAAGAMRIHRRNRTTVRRITKTTIKTKPKIKRRKRTKAKTTRLSC
jgi:hypothetical protein